jgi:hypothetical protein
MICLLNELGELCRITYLVKQVVRTERFDTIN